MIWNGTELELSVDELEDMYTRGLLGPINFSDKNKNEDQTNWEDLIKNLGKKPPKPMTQTVVLYGVTTSFDSPLIKISKPIDGLYEEPQPTKVQASSVEEKPDV